MLRRYMLSILLLALFFFVGIYIYGYFFVAGSVYRGTSAHLKEGVFSVDSVAVDEKSSKDFMKWSFGNDVNIPWNEPYATDTATLIPFSGKARATFINHATVLIETPKLTFLTDPQFAERASPVSFAGPARHHDPYVRLADIPKLDVVLISHNHYDHLSIESITMIEKRFAPHYIVPLNNGQFVARAGVPWERITELDIEASKTIGETRVTLEPARHWSARGFRDRNRYLWGSFMIETPETRIYFAGDTGYGTHFAALKEKYGQIDIALLPIGAYEPRWFMQQMHMNPDDARTAAADLGSPQVMGIHFGTFKLTNEGRHDPEKHTQETLVARPYSNTFLVPTIQNGLDITL